MTLSKRALFVIFPVVLISNLVVAFSVYWIQRQSIEDLETARLSQQLSRLQALFEGDLDFTRNLVFSMLGGSTIRSFMHEPDQDYRTTGIGTKVQDGIEFFSNKNNRFISFAILAPDLKIDYYFENSDQPFADIDPVQIAAAKRLIAGSALSSDEYVDQNGEALIIHSELVDQTTFAAPLVTQKAFSLVVQSAVRPKGFMQLRAAMEKEYRSQIKIGPPSPPAPGFCFHTVSLTPTLTLSMALSDAYMASRLIWLKLVLGIGSIGLSLASVGLLLRLVGRHITGPIALLDRQVTEVFEGRRDSIDGTGGSGEIGHLSANIKVLHDDAVRSLQQVQLMSWTDSLTGISNRSHFNIIGSNWTEMASKAGEVLGLLFIDLDNFKFVNDTYGHATGDAVLQAFTKIASGILDEIAPDELSRSPVLARLSGDEFAILLPSVNESGIAAKIAASIITAFSGGLEVNGRFYPVSASIGIAAYPQDALSFTHLISCADKAMYQAKATGKNTSARYSHGVAMTELRLKLIEDELRRLDPNEEFALVYMPILCRDRRVARCEALLRWNSAILGSVSPGEFIPIAEARGLFSKIDSWVIDRAISEQHHLQDLFGSEIVLSINISSAELYSKAIATNILDCCKRHDVSPSAIEIELTETFAAKIDDRTKMTVAALDDAGFRIALDDFGSGHTSIKQIMEYPIDTIKLDRELVKFIGDERGRRMLQSMIDLCHAQGRMVVAEGVEDQIMHGALMQAGCDLFQGFGICQPSTLQELATWQARQQSAQRPERKLLQMVINKAVSNASPHVANHYGSGILP